MKWSSSAKPGLRRAVAGLLHRDLLGRPDPMGDGRPHRPRLAAGEPLAAGGERRTRAALDDMDANRARVIRMDGSAYNVEPAGPAR